MGVTRQEQQVERLKRMEETLNGLDTSSHAEEEKVIRALLKDVDRVDEVEKMVAALQEKMQGRISGDVKALDANIEKVKELEETWQKLKARLLAEGRSAEKEGKERDKGSG